jgi:NADPH:quinone reductase-like Zn-dependent oxidoreductase
VQALLDEASLRAGQRVLITGAAGGVGHFAVQLAKHVGAHVVATCGPSNLDFVRGLGADEVVDYTKTDVARSEPGFDVVLDAANALDWRRASRLLVRGGFYLGTGGDAASAFITGIGGVLAPMLSGTRARGIVLRIGPTALKRLAELARDGVLQPHIARRVALDGVEDAQRTMETGHGRGKIVVVPHGSIA